MRCDRRYVGQYRIWNHVFVYAYDLWHRQCVHRNRGGHPREKGWFENLFGTLSIGFILTVNSVLISVPCNYIFYDGQVGNTWGDGVIALFESIGINRLVSHIAGQFYIDFLDKVLMCLCLYILIRISRNVKEKNKSADTKKAKQVSAMLLIIALCTELIAGAGMTSLAAEEKTTIDFDRYVQTIYNNENGLLS